MTLTRAERERRILLIRDGIVELRDGFSMWTVTGWLKLRMIQVVLDRVDALLRAERGETSG